MPDLPEAEQILSYGRALAAAIRAFEVLEARAAWFERPVIRLLRYSYRQRLRYLVATLPPEWGDAILLDWAGKM